MWDPGRYRTFLGPRTRAAAELCARVPLEEVDTAVDLGCGPGNSTAVLASAFPRAKLIGLDHSEEMLAAARREGPPGAEFRRGDVREWRAVAPVDLVFSNAVLHWVPDHAEVLGRLVGSVRVGGVVAAQMPRNFQAPSHVLLRSTLGERLTASEVEDLAPAAPVQEPAWYYDLLAAVAEVDLWETEYLHVLEGDDPVLRWMGGTALVPVRASLGDDYADFERVFAARLREAYPRRADGMTVLPFKRLFFCASRTR